MSWCRGVKVHIKSWFIADKRLFICQVCWTSERLGVFGNHHTGSDEQIIVSSILLCPNLWCSYATILINLIIPSFNKSIVPSVIAKQLFASLNIKSSSALLNDFKNPRKWKKRNKAINQGHKYQRRDKCVKVHYI